MRTAGVLFFLWLAVPSLFGQQQCPVRANSSIVADVRATHQELLKDRPEETLTDIPVLIQGHIRSFKDALIVLVDAAMNCAAPSANFDAIQKDLSALLPTRRSDTKNNPDEIFGTDVEMTVSTPTNLPGLTGDSDWLRDRMRI